MTRGIIGQLLATTQAMWAVGERDPDGRALSSGTPATASVGGDPAGIRLRLTSYTGSYRHPSDGVECRYEVDCRITIDDEGRESMHLRGQVAHGLRQSDFVVVGQAEPPQSFRGRERAVALDCVAVARARYLSSRQGATDSCAARPSNLGA